MDKYLNTFREMISLRGLTDHTLKNYCTYIRWIQRARGPGDDSQLPMRRFDEYLPYVPSREDTWTFLSTISDLKQKICRPARTNRSTTLTDFCAGNRCIII